MPESSIVERGDLSPRSHLVMVRVWREDLGEGRIEWRGKIQHVSTGEVKYFREWQTLIACLAEMLPPLQGDSL